MISSIQPKKYQCSICSQLGHNKRTCPLQDAQDSDIFTQRFKAYILNDAETPASNVSDKTEEQYFAEYEEWMTYMNEAVQEIFEQKREYHWKEKALDQLQVTKWIYCLLICFLKDDPEPIEELEDDEDAGDDENEAMDILQDLFCNLSQD